MLNPLNYWHGFQFRTTSAVHGIILPNRHYHVTNMKSMLRYCRQIRYLQNECTSTNENHVPVAFRPVKIYICLTSVVTALSESEIRKY